jgi:uncharacterized phage protein (TIGR02218 family)
MKTLPPAVQAYLAANNVAWRADLFTFTVASGAVYRWTTADVNLVVSGQTYLADGSVLSRSSLRQSVQLEVDGLTIRLGGTALLAGVTLSKLALQGFFDGARMQLDHLIGNPTLPPILKLFEGAVAEVQPEPTVITLSVKSELSGLNCVLPRFVYQASCGHALYDANCGVSKTATACTVQASPSPTTRSFARTPTTPNAALGFVEFVGNVTPALAGLRYSIATDVSGVLTVSPALLVAPAAGDQVNVYRGCDRTRNTCLNVFNNAAKNRGFTHIPKPNAAG